MFESSDSQTDVGEETMTDMRSRSGILVGLAAAVGAFGAAAMMSAATAPTARADDFTDVINAVDGDFTFAQGDFTQASGDFDTGDVADGLAKFLSGVDNDFIAAPDNLYIGTVDLLTNEPVADSIEIGLFPESDFTSGLADAHTLFADGETDFTTAVTDLSSGDYAGAADLGALGSFLDVAGVQELLEGVVASF
jgi:hypothetical protein